MSNSNDVERVGEVAGEALARVGELIRTQDNRATAAPIFAVQERRRIYGLNDEWAEDFLWMNGEGECEDWEDGAERVGYRDNWEFVTACFTEEGCKEFIRINGHNLKHPRIYAYGSWRNAEWQAVRDHLAALPSVTPLSERTA